MPRWPAEGIAWLRGLLRDYARSGRTVLYSSHVLPEVEQLADQVMIMHRSRLVRHDLSWPRRAAPGSSPPS